MSKDGWQNDKPTEPCACDYERNGIFSGVVFKTNSGELWFSGYVIADIGYALLSKRVSELPGRWNVRTIEPPPTLLTPGRKLQGIIEDRIGNLYSTDACDVMAAKFIEAYKAGELELPPGKG